MGEEQSTSLTDRADPARLPPFQTVRQIHPSSSSSAGPRRGAEPGPPVDPSRGALIAASFPSCRDLEAGRGGGGGKQAGEGTEATQEPGCRRSEKRRSRGTSVHGAAAILLVSGNRGES